MALHDDAETQLLLSVQNAPQYASRQISVFIVIFLQLAEPLTSQLIRDVRTTHGDETKVEYYVGTTVAIFYSTQAMTVLHWSRLPDRIGQKPVIPLGLIGLSRSVYCFGLSQTFWGLVVSRSINGAMNENIGEMKHMFTEMSDAKNLAQKVSVISPCFLPCAVPATFSAIAWVVTLLFVKEIPRGPSVLSIPPIFLRKDSISTPIDQETAGRVEVGSASTGQVETEHEATVPLRGLLARRVIVAVSDYAFLALVDVAIRAMQPVFFLTPIELEGLGLPTARIENLLTVFGLLNGIFQVFYFARVHDYLRSKTMFIIGLANALPTFGAMPLMNYLARTQGSVLVWVIVFVHALLIRCVLPLTHPLSLCALFIYISAVAPNRASLGATNGL
ncbi:member of major facilitator superfamily multidrug-resistance, DHA1 sub-family [Mycena olivaceomarginata]|nr:member of major facilitator superfamily multidrug-resistance, DHA1 sub-family [Mycena olivaceomarginata]